MKLRALDMLMVARLIDQCDLVALGGEGGMDV